MRRRAFITVFIALALVGVFGMQGLAEGHRDHGRNLHAKLSGYREVPPISTVASGSFKGKVNGAGTAVDYTLTYTGLEAAASAAHLHFGQRGVAGGVLAFLCGGGGKAACPATAGTVTGTLVAADVQSLTAQGIDAGAFAEVLAAIRANITYVNVHSAKFPNGEIRGDVK